MSEQVRKNNSSAAYLRILKQYAQDTQKVWDHIFSRVSGLITLLKIDDKLEEFNNEQSCKLWYQNIHYARDIHKYQAGIKFIYWLLLRANQFKHIRLVELPSIIEEVINLLQRQAYPQQIIPFIYIICSSYSQIFVKDQIFRDNKDKTKWKNNPNYITPTINFRELQSIYVSTQSLWLLFRQKPLLKLSNLIWDNNYQVYNQNFMADFCNVHCILSTTLINQQQFKLIQRNIVSKFITFNLDNKIKIITNNYFLNKFQQLTLQKLLATDELNQKITKQFSLTFSLTGQTLTKIISFFYLIPPELSPFSKHSILTYQNSDFTNIFFRIATQSYWQYCPKNQFIEVYYLSNQSEVQWLCIPSYIYKSFQQKFSAWDQSSFEYIQSRTQYSYRGIQRKGQLVVIQNGYEYFWKVKVGSSAFIKWSLLPKQTQVIESYTDIIGEYDDDVLTRKWRIEYPHRYMIISYVCHQWMHLQILILKKLINIVLVKLQIQQSKYISLLEKGSDLAELTLLIIPKRLRLCGYCGQEILNYFLLVNKYIYCLDCIQSITLTPHHQLKYCYIRKPEKLRILFNQLLQQKQNLSNSTLLEQLVSVQIDNLSENHHSAIEIKNNCPELDKKLQNSEITNQFNFKKEDVSLFLFQKKSSFYSPEPLFKHLALKTIGNEFQLVQMQQLLKIMAKFLLSEDEKQCLQRDICRFYLSNNYVFAGLDALRNSQR